jgi:hypothetical protein
MHHVLKSIISSYSSKIAASSKGTFFCIWTVGPTKPVTGWGKSVNVKVQKWKGIHLSYITPRCKIKYNYTTLIRHIICWSTIIRSSAIFKLPLRSPLQHCLVNLMLFGVLFVFIRAERFRSRVTLNGCSWSYEQRCSGHGSLLMDT